METDMLLEKNGTGSYTQCDMDSMHTNIEGRVDTDDESDISGEIIVGEANILTEEECDEHGEYIGIRDGGNDTLDKEKISHFVKGDMYIDETEFGGYDIRSEDNKVTEDEYFDPEYLSDHDDIEFRDGRNDMLDKEMKWLEKKSTHISRKICNSTQNYEQEIHDEYEIYRQEQELQRELNKKQAYAGSKTNLDTTRKKVFRKGVRDIDEDYNREKNTRKVRKEVVKVKQENEEDEEYELLERIQRLKLMEQEVEKEARRKRMLKERKRKQMDMERKLKLEQEKRRLKDKRIKELKDQEKMLENSLVKMQTELSLLDTDTSDDSDIDGKRTIRQNSTKSRMKDGRKHRERNDGNTLADIVERQITEREKVRSHIYKPTVPKLTESSFEEWKIEINVMIRSDLYQEDILRQAVRNSLSGNTRKILLTLAPDATTKDIVDKLDTVYGNVRSGESVIAEFYQSNQKKDEGVSEWGIRLEGILQTAIEKGHIQRNQKDNMLKTRFWRHLYNVELRNATRICYETAIDFEDLQRQIRKEEAEMRLVKNNDAPKHINTQQTEMKEQMTILKIWLRK